MIRNDKSPVKHSASLWLGSGVLMLVLCGCAGRYRTEHGQWVFVWWNEGTGRTAKYVEGVDPETFQKLSPAIYAKDKNHVYLRGEVIPAADPASFEHLVGRYARDSHRVFLDTKVVSGADSATFHKLRGQEILGRDKNDFYYGDSPFHVIDLASFKVINDGWAKDSSAYYAYGYFHYIRRVNCDYASMNILNGSWAKDRNRAYYQGLPIEGVDLPSFHACDDLVAKDKNRTYRDPEFERIQQNRNAPK